MTEERQIKHERLARWLKANGLDGVVLTRRCNFSWYTCGASNRVPDADEIGASSLVVPAAGRAALVATNIEAPRLMQEDLTAQMDLELHEYPYHDAAARERAFRAATGSGSFAADTAPAGLDLAPTDEAFDRLRWQLTAAEIDRYRRLCRDVAEGVEAAGRLAEGGMTESALAGVMNEQLRRRDCLPWVALIGADERITSFRHPLPTGHRIRECAMLITCAGRGGLIAAATRIVAFGQAPDELVRKTRAAATVDAAMICSTRPGATLGEVFAVARQAYGEVGFADQWMLHHQGGSIGYLPREVLAGPGCEVPVLEDQPFAWNPSITGTKSEGTILCRRTGCEVLTRTGEWPTIEAEWQGRTVPRPGILVV